MYNYFERLYNTDYHILSYGNECGEKGKKEKRLNN